MPIRPSFKHRERKGDGIDTPDATAETPSEAARVRSGRTSAPLRAPPANRREAFAARLQAGKKLAKNSPSKLEKKVAAAGAAFA
jgi:hypothetical protein